jgi:hypothetical protein
MRVRAFDVVAGTENFSGRNAIDQDIIELNDAFTLMKGKHTWTIGTHNEFLDLPNLFIRDAFGTYTFSSLANFEAGLAQSYNRSFSATSDPLSPRRSRCGRSGFMPATRPRASQPDADLRPPLRCAELPDQAQRQPGRVSNFGFGTDVVPSPVQWSPRFGVTMTSAARARGRSAAGSASSPGVRPMSGCRTSTATPGSTSRASARQQRRNNIPFVTDALKQPTTVTGATAGSFSNEIDMIDPDFKFRRSCAATSATTTRCGAGSRALRLRVLEDGQGHRYENLNFVRCRRRPASAAGRSSPARCRR